MVENATKLLVEEGGKVVWWWPILSLLARKSAY
jgi:hypothetical protein